MQKNGIFEETLDKKKGKKNMCPKDTCMLIEITQRGS